MLEEGQLLVLNDNKEYMIVGNLKLHNINYVYLLTTSKPLEALVVTAKEKDGQIVFDEIKDNEELEYVLNQFITAQDE